MFWVQCLLPGRQLARIDDLFDAVANRPPFFCGGIDLDFVFDFAFAFGIACGAGYIDDAAVSWCAPKSLSSCEIVCVSSRFGWDSSAFDFGATLWSLNFNCSGTGVFVRSRLECCGVLSSSGVYWVARAFTLSDDLALGFALGLGPSDRALLALACGSVFAFAFGLPLGGSVEDAGCKSLGGSSGFHVIRVGSRANFPLAPLYGSCRTEPDGASPCGRSSAAAARSSG